MVRAILLLLFALSALPLHVFAQTPSEDTKEAARDLLDQGDTQRARGDLTQALRSYEAADKLMAVPTTRIEVARTLFMLGRLIEARAAAERVLAIPVLPEEPQPFTIARGEASTLLAALELEIPAVSLSIEGPVTTSIRLTLNGSAVPLVDLLRVDPGAHTLTAEAPGFLANTISLEVGRAERRSVVIDLVPIVNDPSPPGVEASPIFWSGLAGTIAGAGVGVGFGIASLSIAADVEERCAGFTNCPSSLADERDQAVDFANVSNVAFGLAGASAIVMVVGVVLSVSEPSADVALTNNGLQLRF